MNKNIAIALGLGHFLDLYESYQENFPHEDFKTGFNPHLTPEGGDFWYKLVAFVEEAERSRVTKVGEYEIRIVVIEGDVILSFALNDPLPDIVHPAKIRFGVYEYVSIIEIQLVQEFTTFAEAQGFLDTLAKQ